MFPYLIIILIVLLVMNRWKNRRLIKVHQKIGTDIPYLPIIGHAHNYFGNNEDIFRNLMKLFYNSFKTKNAICSLWLAYRFVVAIADPIQATAVLRKAMDKNFVYKFLSNFTGNSLIFAPGIIWHRRRKILAPTFAPRNITKFIKMFETNAKLMLEQFDSRVGTGDFSCWNYLTRYTLDSICETTLGVKVCIQKEPDHPFFNAYEEYNRDSANRLLKFWMHYDFVYKLLPMYNRQKRSLKIVHDFVDNIINQKQKLMNECAINTNNAENSTNFKSFLEMMLEVQDTGENSYTLEEIREESLILMIAGNDTTATAIGFTAVLLSQHQDIQDKVYKELEEVLGDTNRPLELEDILKLKYLDAVVKESLRLYPPVPFIVRDSPRDLVLPMGLTVPGGSDFVIGIAGIHRNPHYWGADAEDFKPERFLSGITSVPGAFIPFSFGPRNCIGYLYAMLSIKTTLVTIVRRYRLLPATSFVYDKEHPLRLSFEIITKHMDHFEMQLQYRHQSG